MANKTTAFWKVGYDAGMLGLFCKGLGNMGGVGWLLRTVTARRADVF